MSTPVQPGDETRDLWTIRIVVISVTLLTLALAAFGGLLMYFTDKDASEVWQLVGIGLGALVGMLVSIKGVRQ